MKRAVLGSLLYVVLVLLPGLASAESLLDKLNAATKKMNETSQRSQQNSQQQTPSGQAQSGGGSLSSALGATTVNRDFPTCMAQTAGAHERLTAQVLQRKLDQSKNLSPQQRRTIEEDVQWFNATASGGRPPAPDPKNPQRYLLVLTDEDQMEIHAAYSRFSNEVHEKCEAQYGGMSQFADPSGWRHAPIDTRVSLPDLQQTALSPAKPTAQEERTNCLAALQGLRWQLMADKMENKLKVMAECNSVDYMEVGAKNSKVNFGN